MSWLLASLLFWGFWAFLPKLAARSLSPRGAFLSEVAGGIFVGWFVVLLFGVDFDIIGFFYAFLAGLCSYLGVFLYILLLSKGQKVALASIITGLYPLVAVVLSYSFLGERPRAIQWIGIGLAGIAIILINESSNPEKDNKGHSEM